MRLLGPEMETVPEALVMLMPPQVRLPPRVFVRVEEASQVAVSAVVGTEPSVQEAVVLRLPAVALRMSWAWVVETRATKKREKRRSFMAEVRWTGGTVR
jgi:hypothetical protein